MKIQRDSLWVGLFLCISVAANAQNVAGSGKDSYHVRFDFGSGKVEKGFLPVTPVTLYSKVLGYGFLPEASVQAVSRGGKDALKSDFCTSDNPFFFTVDVPEGNYDVQVTLGDSEGESLTTVKAECRRLMIEKVQTQAGRFVTQTFTVNVRNRRIADTSEVKLKPRELSYLHWDNQLTLEFGNTLPKVCALEITRNKEGATVFLAGNSTVVDQDREPWAAWGQMIPAFFKSGRIAIANHAESGESASSFIKERRLEKILSLMKVGDYLFIEFAHNDQKQTGPNIGPFTSYKKDLKYFVSETRKRGGSPVLVTSMHRRNFDSTGHIVNTLGDYPEAMRQVAREENVPLIDLNAMSKTLYEAWGPEKSLKAFVHYPAGSFPGQEKELKDNTHFSTYGAYEIAKCIVVGIKAAKLAIAQYLKENIPAFDPAKPDAVETWSLPLSPLVQVIKPDGN
ncbi:rhamnogalacturonan acetylesterase [Cytophagaceae bacterium YF14B1]|uniref:Rhamnogalacturonan acetylesterase n=1 Tax=Xanthocytophaga flava TaxID=3048013 RepID=A0AAE3U4B0_9BACT|nr:rhamnogalacturonan acetylesterase [Xanthocytophaga flavus]MDJ1479594.1 rhamnogalacturonan acetylesterase [Xanthocytophaga flavus]